MTYAWKRKGRQSYTEADAELRKAAAAVLVYLNEHHGVMRSGSNAALRLREAWLSAERPIEHRRRMKEGG